MNEFIKILLSMSVSGTLLLLLIRGLKRFYKNKFSRRWQYYIWIIALLRFLLPFTPGPAIVGTLFEKFDSAAAANDRSTAPDTSVSENTDSPAAESIQTDKEQAGTVMHQPFPIVTCLFLIWSAMALVLFVRKITAYQSFIQYIKAGCAEVSDIKILNLLSDCQEKLNIKTKTELSCNPLTASPVMTGFFRPTIILPPGRLDDRLLSYIFMHELIHYKQKDLFYKWLIQAVVCIHWFNPFVYLLEKEVNRSCELSCDEKAVSLLDEKERRAYGDTLIFFLKSDNPFKNSCASVTLTEGAEQLKERLGAIMKFKKKSKKVLTATAVFSAAICVCFFVFGAYAAPSANTDSKILHDDLTEDGVYYIFCDGAEETDKPRSSVIAGNFLFVLVRKDSYTSIGPFDHQETLLEDVRKQCTQMKSLTQEEKELVIKTASEISEKSNHSASYEKLAAYKTENYSQQSIADFNARLASTPDELTELLAANADVRVSPNDENYDFITTTIGLSANELYCGHMDEECTFYAGISKNSRLGKELDQDGEIWYEFFCTADLQVAYSIVSPELVTVAERDHTLLAFEKEMQDFLNGLSESEITKSSIKAVLAEKADELMNRLSDENMKLLSCEISFIDIHDSK